MVEGIVEVSMQCRELSWFEHETYRIGGEFATRRKMLVELSGSD